MKLTYRQASRDDVTHQFRYYLIEVNVPDVALRFKNAIRETAQEIKLQPRMAPPYYSSNPSMRNLRSLARVWFSR